jgi:predicted unusual protein kinase regulating ubiquinone biosynthesis (AarF/ABC1/UbiB family)
MEYVPSIKITDTETMNSLGFNTERICETLVKLFLSQIIEKGIVHNDTQQGNIGVLDDGKTIVLYDFGNVITFTKQFRESIGMIAFCVTQKDVDEFVELLTELNILYIQDENDKLEVKAFFAYFFKYLDGLDMSALKTSIVSSDVEGKFKDNLNINPDFLSLFRVFSLLDGTIARLDPTFSYIDALTPYAQNVFRDTSFLDIRARKDFMKLSTYPRALNNTDANMMRVQNKMINMRKDMQYMQSLMVSLFLAEHFVTDPYTFAVAFPVLYYIFVWRKR